MHVKSEPLDIGEEASPAAASPVDPQGEASAIATSAIAPLGGAAIATSTIAQKSAPRDLDDLFGEFSSLIVKRTEKRALEKEKATMADVKAASPEQHSIVKRQRIRFKTKGLASTTVTPPSAIAEAGPSAVASTIVTPPTTSSAKPRAKVGEKARAKPSAIASSILDGRSSAGSSSWLPQPPLQQTAPIDYKGCRIYTTVKTKAWRVVPYPGRSVYDKAFYWGDAPNVSWSNLMSYCDNPVLPESRRADIL